MRRRSNQGEIAKLIRQANARPASIVVLSGDLSLRTHSLSVSDSDQGRLVR